jgi:hypothetical protein
MSEKQKLPIKTADELMTQCAQLAEMDIEIEPLQTTLRIRALSKTMHHKIRAEARKGDGFDDALVDLGVLKHGIIAPVLSEAQFKQLCDTAPAGVMEFICECVLRLSGLTLERHKEVEKLFTSTRI